MIKVTEYHKIEDVYYTDLSKRKHRYYGNKTLEEIYREEFEKHIKCDLRTLLCSSFDKLSKIKLPTGINDEIAKLFDYQNKYQKHISDIFKKHLEIHTCYYCNIDFINLFKTTNKNTKSGYTLDHILPKTEYPHLALSLYNIIPSCYICNSKLKKEQNIGKRVPTSNSFDFDERVRFKTFMSNPHLIIENEKDFELLLKEDFSDLYSKYIEVFELNGRYAHHKYKVLEMIQKRKAYPDSRIRELAQLTQKTEEEVKQDLFGNYLPDENELHKYSLSKLIKDISQEIGLI